jgi:hypothetical protein
MANEMELEDFGNGGAESLAEDEDVSSAPSTPVKVNVIMWVNQVYSHHDHK